MADRLFQYTKSWAIEGSNWACTFSRKLGQINDASSGLGLRTDGKQIRQRTFADYQIHLARGLKC